VFWYSRSKKSPWTPSEVISSSEFLFVCVPTPIYSDYSGIDPSIVDSVVFDVASKVSGTDKILIIKSTVIPGTTAGYAKKYPKVKFAMVPEFLTEKTPEYDFLHPARTIIGAFDKNVAERIKKLHQPVLPKDSPYFLTDPTSAELAKYMSNTMLAAKVLLANEYYALSQKLGVNYDSVRKMVEADKRVGTHLRVPGPDGDLGFGGKCFPKDIVALLGLGRALKVDLSALEAIWKKNLKIRKNRDWEEIPGAVSGAAEGSTRR
ncbi:MAG: UDP-glucose/GDP-mannose dehydrogenase family protein, partial [Candidatus Blackburnbacteria bacterium]|nr:UDP-glucose/GDP-mannose dehydrogenase family protein [Candidatus Blackburnbacteria bacterium]